MPIFEYRCSACDNNFEELVLGSQTVVCPECKSEKIEKQMSSFAATGKSSSAIAPCGKSPKDCGSSGFG